ncbi:MAG: hypothetical protein ACRELV_04925 [Longimicrobiales bacterium]
MRRNGLGAILLFALAAPLAAQRETYGVPADASCSTGPITTIFIDNHSIFDVDDPDLDDRFDWAYDIANRLHVQTDRDVIRRELLFGMGECFDPMLAEESERLLRNLPFLSSIDIFGVAQADGSYHVVVDTRDEWSTRVDVRLRFEDGFGIQGGEVREENLFGTGRSLAIHYFEHEVTRDYGVTYFTPQLFDTRWDLTAGLGKTRAGTFFEQRVEFPFVGEVGRWSARQSFQRRDRFFDFIDTSDPDGLVHVLLPIREKAFDIGVTVRVGPPSNLTILGGALTYQEFAYPGGFGSIGVTQGSFDELGTDSARAAAVWSGLSEIQNIRAVLMLGQRNIWWIQRRGLDSMRGVQDIPLGAEIQLGLGRSLPALQPEDDFYGTLTFYTGVDVGPVLTATRVRVDARRDFDAPADASEWENVYAEGELLGYWKPGGSEHHTLFARAAGVAGWHTRTPFQLTLGGDVGVRGYEEERFPGARRVTFTLEDRIYFGWPFADVLDLGATLFADLGRVFPGDVPFGTDSGWRSSAGLGLRAAFPPGGRTNYRIDFAVPVDGGVDWGSPRIVISIGDPIGLTAPFSDPQLVRSRTAGVFNNLFAVRR